MKMKRRVKVDETWLVVVLAFLLDFLRGGLSFAFGMFYAELMKTSTDNSVLVSSAPAFQACFANLFGVFAGSCCKKWGYQVTIIIGSFITSLGYLIAAIFPNLTSLVIGIGVVSGVGISFLLVPAWTIVNTYYDDRRQLANGISISGSSVGVFVAEPAVYYIISFYGVHGTLLILAGNSKKETVGIYEV